MEAHKIDFSGNAESENKNTRAQMAQKKDLDDQRDTDVNNWNRGYHQIRIHLSIIISEVNQLYVKLLRKAKPEYTTVPLI